MNAEEEDNGFEEEWDADFLDQLIQVEEFALSSTSLSHTQNPNPIPPSLSLQPQQKQHQQYHNNAACLSYSPPRQLSQKPVHFHNNDNSSNASIGISSLAPPFSSLPQQENNPKDQEIVRLKKELENVSKQLSDLERECFLLKNERNKKEEGTKSVYFHGAEKVTGIRRNLEHGVPVQDNHGASKQSTHAKAFDTDIGNNFRSANSSPKAIGVQTDQADDFSNFDLNDDLPSQANISEKLLGIWGSASDQSLSRNLLSKLFVACPADLQFLFGHMSRDICSKSGDSIFNECSSGAALQYSVHSFSDSEAAKVSNLYSALTKVSNGLLQLEALLGPLIDLCCFENVAIVYSSLSVLHVFLKHLLCLGRKLGERDNVKVEGKNCKDRGLFIGSEKGASFASYEPFGTKCSDYQILCKQQLLNADIRLPLSCVNWVSLFELLHQIVVSKTQECVRLKAISVMNVILLSTNAHTEREMFGQAPVFKSVAQFLKKEAGSQVQKETLHLLYLLLNCPKLLSVFCFGRKEEDGAANNDDNASTCKELSAILEGLADCIACRGNSIKDTELRKRAVILLAFLASSGRSGFEIVVNHKLPGEKNFIMLVLQVLISEMDAEMSLSSEPAECIKARILLMREALILLNRLVSNPGYSAIVLQVLTASREITSLTIDIVTRLSRKDQILRLSDNITRQMRESEIVDLARVLKKRVFTYLGDKMT